MLMNFGSLTWDDTNHVGERERERGERGKDESIKFADIPLGEY